jgi:hypothetical protein
MSKHHIAVNVTVNIFKEGGRFIADCPTLQHTTHGATAIKVKKNFHEVLSLWRESVCERKMLRRALTQLGWTFKPTLIPAETEYKSFNISHLIQSYERLEIPAEVL